MGAKNFFSKEQKRLIVSAIKEAERATSGEIRLHVEKHCGSDVMEHRVEL